TRARQPRSPGLTANRPRTDPRRVTPLGQARPATCRLSLYPAGTSPIRRRIRSWTSRIPSLSIDVHESPPQLMSTPEPWSLPRPFHLIEEIEQLPSIEGAVAQVGSCRPECPDWMLIASEGHLRRVRGDPIPRQ